jgi:hypothetical protein
LSRWNADRSVSVEILKKTLKMIHHVIMDLLEKDEFKIDSTLALKSPSVSLTAGISLKILL